MRTAAFAGTQRGPIGSVSILPLARALSLPLARHVGTRALKNWLASLRHSARRRGCRANLCGRRRRSRINRTWPGLRNDQSARWRHGPVRNNCCFCRWSCRRRCSSQTSGCIAGYWDRYLRLHRHGVNCWLYRFGSRLNCQGDLLLECWLGRLRHFFGGCRGRRRKYGGRNCRRFRGNCYRGRRTRHGLRRDEARRWLGCLYRRNRH